MSTPPSAGLGARLAEYRRIAGLSARELAERCGTGLTRGVIANIESGRKTDITVDQLLALSWALGVPPVTLALPITEPFLFVELARDQVPSHAASDWFEGEPVLSTKPSTAGVLADARRSTIRAYLDKLATSRFAEDLPEVPEEKRAELRAEVAQLELKLQQMLVDLAPHTPED